MHFWIMPLAAGLIALLGAGGIARADWNEAERAYKAGDYKRAAEEYLIDAKAGNAEAQNALAILYASGQGVAQSYAEALRWFTDAAKRGHSQAQFNLAICYLDGLGVAKDPAAAVKWFAAAAEQGMADAQTNLGVAYYRGEGVRQDLIEAFKWFTIADGTGDPIAKNFRKQVAGEMKPEDIEAAKARAIAWREAFLERNQPR